MGDTVKKSPLLSVARKIRPAIRLNPVTELVCFWAIYYAFLHGSQAADAIYGHSKGSPPVLTGAAAVVARALNHGMLWCSALQAAAGLLLLMLLVAGRPRRSRWAVAFAALVATTASHCIWVMIHALAAVANLEGHVSIVYVLNLLIAVIVLAAVDVADFSLLFQGEDEEIYRSA